MIRNLIEKILFFLKKIPTWQQAFTRTPEGTLTRYRMCDINVGNLRWNNGGYDLCRYRPSFILL